MSLCPLTSAGQGHGCLWAEESCLRAAGRGPDRCRPPPGPVGPPRSPQGLSQGRCTFAQQPEPGGPWVTALSTGSPGTWAGARGEGRGSPRGSAGAFRSGQRPPPPPASEQWDCPCLAWRPSRRREPPCGAGTAAHGAKAAFVVRRTDPGADVAGGWAGRLLDPPRWRGRLTSHPQRHGGPAHGPRPPTPGPSRPPHGAKGRPGQARCRLWPLWPSEPQQPRRGGAFGRQAPPSSC